MVVRVCIRKPVNKGFSADFAKWNISDASVGTEALDDQMLEGTEGGPVDDGTMDDGTMDEGAADATGSGDAEVQ